MLLDVLGEQMDRNNRGARMRSWGLKTGIVLCAMASLTMVPYVLLGLWNRVFGGWTSVFYCYAGSTQFIDTYAPRFLVRTFRWMPVPIGVLKHEGTRGVVIASPVSEQQFLDPSNNVAFQKLQRRIRRIAWLIGARRVSLTGIMPSAVVKDGILNLPDTRPIVQRAVGAAVSRIVRERFDEDYPPILLIGGAGHVGVPIASSLKAAGATVHVIDPRESKTTVPQHLRGTPCLILDCSRKGVIESYVDQFWPGMVLLNEVFPRPSRKVVGLLSDKGVECWHLSGLAGSIVPPLPHGYENAVPCCAAHDASDDPDVVIVPVNAPIAARVPLTEAA